MKTTNNSQSIKKDLRKLFSYAERATALRHCNGNIELRRAVNTHYDRVGIYTEPVSVKLFCDNLISKKAIKLAKCLPDEGYSMGSVVNLRVGHKTYTNDRRKYYSNSCKYKELHGRVDVYISPNEFRYAHAIGGLLTIIYPQKSKVKKCVWFEGHGNKQHFEIKRVQGWIYGGYHSTDKKMALERGTGLIERSLLAEKREMSIAKAKRRQYTFQDSLEAGNCEAGTRAFILRLGLKSDRKYRGEFLLKEAQEKSSNSVYYVNRMIKHFAK